MTMKEYIERVKELHNELQIIKKEIAESQLKIFSHCIKVKHDCHRH